MNYAEIVKDAQNQNDVEKFLFQQNITRIMGVDEVGRAPLAGPVTACAYNMTAAWTAPWVGRIKDSKKLKPTERYALFELLLSGGHHEIAQKDNDYIDKQGITRACDVAMIKSIQGLLAKMPTPPQIIVIDGNRIPEGFKAPCPVVCLPKADGLSLNVAAASIIAKCDRDTFMEDCHEVYPDYGFDSHKGYGTPQHIKAIRDHGTTPLHRLTFNRVRSDDVDQRAHS